MTTAATSRPTTFHAVRGRPLGRGRPQGPVHAVPVDDTTRTAVCGARVGGAQHAVPAHATPHLAAHGGVATCPDCSPLLATHTS